MERFPPSKICGLTLIELLVIIAIIAVLTALLLPAFSSLDTKRHQVGCVSNMRQLYTAFMLYRSENNGYLAPGGLMPPADPPAGGNANYNWKNLLIPTYLSKVPYCPAMKVSDKGRPFHPDAKAYLESLGSYGLNGYLLGVKLEALPGSLWGDTPYCGDSRFVFLAETVAGCGATWNSTHQNTVLDDGLDAGKIYNVAPRNHGDHTLNYCFVDGHIEALTVPLKSDGKTRDWDAIFGFGSKNGGAKYVGPYGNKYTGN